CSATSCGPTTAPPSTSRSPPPRSSGARRTCRRCCTPAPPGRSPDLHGRRALKPRSPAARRRAAAGGPTGSVTPMPAALRASTEPRDGAAYADKLAVAREAEAVGFAAFFGSGHSLRGGEGSGEPGPTAAWITLAGLARETERIRLGTL